LYIIFFLLFILVLEKVLSVLLFVKKQNKQILALLNKKNVQPDSVSAVEELPVSLPLMNEEDLSVLETHLQDKNNSNAIVCKFLFFPSEFFNISISGILLLFVWRERSGVTGQLYFEALLVERTGFQV
jgi:hypothetical protein